MAIINADTAMEFLNEEIVRFRNEHIGVVMSPLLWADNFLAWFNPEQFDKRVNASLDFMREHGHTTKPPIEDET